MEQILPVLSFTFVLALLAGTFRSIRLNLLRDPGTTSQRIAIIFFETIEWLLWTSCLISLVVAAPHPITIVLLMMFAASIVTAGRLRYREEAGSLNRWLQLAAETGTSIIPVGEKLADGFRSRIAKQTRVFAMRLNRGESIVDAARRSRLPLDADTLAAFLVPTPEVVSNNDATRLSLLRESRELTLQDENSSRPTSLVPQQFVYVVATAFLAWLIAISIRTYLTKLFDEMFEQFSMTSSITTETLNFVGLIGNFLIAFMAVWLAVSVAIRWLPLSVVRWVPWFGDQAVTRWRCDVLQALERGIRVQQPASQIFHLASQSARVRWVSRRCDAVHRLVESGTTLPTAMQNAKLITPRERVWLTTAERNGNLADAIQLLVGNLQRRQTLLWKLRMAWFVPVATLLIGIFVLAHTMYMFYLMNTFILALS
ncbi:type II secretion system F family protein [Aporhodopirellula aestuarii]|uniref:Type II secretion system F family protein n=1 Tax=Aporhodopirellula aestuarii TaxID=2950107 RepID=A0ABT0U9U4_9BACT|nr:type II secretion system F family protein [Aporhodopirellula aestuarii]MCM2373163.1 type II secretion system F family protein [Aporhodopirellula aestuarii]